MKVVQLLPDLDGGGVERGTLEVAKALVDAGHESVVLSAGGRMVAQLEAEGSRHVNWDLGRKSLWTFRHIWALRRWLQQEQPDILHVRSRLPAWVAWLAWRGMKPSARPHFVTTVHGLYSVGRYSSIMCRGERVIAVSKTVERYIRDHYPDTDMARVRLIYRGIDPAEFPYGYQPSETWLERWYSDFPQLKGKKVLTLPGRLTRLKGHHDFIDLIKLLKAQGEPVHGLIVGGEDPKRKAYAQELKVRIEEEQLGGDITFTGSRSDMLDVYAVSDLVFSLSAKPESFGRTTCEALSVGTAVVGLDYGGVGEILSELFPEGRMPQDATDEMLAASVRTILARDLKPGNRQVFTLQRMLDDTLSLYMSLLAR